MSVLDIGCGTGQLLQDIRQRSPSARLYGLDLCKGMIRKAREVLGEEAVLVVGDSQALPFESGTFDVVVCTHSFHHYPDQVAVLRDMYRVLKPGGVAMVLDGYPDSLWGWLLYDIFVVWGEGPVRHRSAKDMRQLYHAAGFTGVQQHHGFPCSPVLLTLGFLGTETHAG